MIGFNALFEACSKYLKYLEHKPSYGPWELTEDLKAFGIVGWIGRSDESLELVFDSNTTITLTIDDIYTECRRAIH
jgi:hypothetical protein